MNTEDFNFSFPLSRISTPKTRRALIHSFKDEVAAIAIVEVLIYLTLNYLSMMTNHKRLLDAHDGFMEKGYRDISFYTGLQTASGAVPKREISAYIKILEKTCLIETSRGGFNNTKRIKVNLAELEKYMTEAEEAWKPVETGYISQQRDLREKSIKKVVSNTEKSYGLDPATDHLDDAEVIADRLDRLSDVIDLRDFKEVLTGTSVESYWTQIWFFSYYYEKYTGKPYWWSGIKLEILISTWKDRPLNEYAITTAIDDSLKKTRDKGFNAYQDFERRFRQYYNSYLKSVPEGILFDNLRNL